MDKADFLKGLPLKPGQKPKPAPAPKPAPKKAKK